MRNVVGGRDTAVQVHSFACLAYWQSRRREFPAPALLLLAICRLSAWRYGSRGSAHRYANIRPTGHSALGKTVGVYRCYGAIRSQTKVASLEK